MLNLPQNPKWDIAQVSHSTLVNADCFDVFPFIEDKSIDAVICDLPYGATNCKWDSILPFDLLWKEYERIIKPNGAIVLFGSQPFTSALIMSNSKNFKFNFVWDKNRGNGHLVAKIRPLQRTEDICVFGYDKIKYNPQMIEREKVRKNTKEGGKRTEIMGGSKNDNYEFKESTHRYPTNYLFYPHSPSKTFHPTQKPLELLEYLIKTYTNEGDTVLDNTMGSGTTNLACLKLNRKSIGIEKEKQYYDVAVRRLSSYCG
jgi:site-specific DNA-methyltransferase (adenine-specific)